MVSVSEVDEKIAPCLLQGALHGHGVGEIAVVGDRQTAVGKLGEEGLHVAQAGAAGGRIARVADRPVAEQTLHHGGLGESVADQPDMALDVELRAVIGDDAGGFLAAMLQRVQAERDDRCGVLPAKNAEHAAFVVEMVVGLVGQQAVVCARVRHWPAFGLSSQD